jgi:hypothetical protein
MSESEQFARLERGLQAVAGGLGEKIVESMERAMNGRASDLLSPKQRAWKCSMTRAQNYGSQEMVANPQQVAICIEDDRVAIRQLIGSIIDAHSRRADTSSLKCKIIEIGAEIEAALRESQA